MGWLDRFRRRPEAKPPYDPPPTAMVKVQEAVQQRAAFPSPSRWPGWPSDWLDPTWDGYRPFTGLVDTAWMCLDLNSSVIASMPPYLTKGGEIIQNRPWLTNPDPTTYTSWYDFAKEAWGEYQSGEVFIVALARDWTGYPSHMRVIPACFVNINPDGSYQVGSIRLPKVDVLHIRYQRVPGSQRGVGPLEAAGARMTAASLMARRIPDLIEKGITPPFYLWTEQKLTREQAQATLDTWLETRSEDPTKPAFMSGGTDIKVPPSKSPQELALVELQQFTESRIATLLGVPPFLVGLPSGGDSMTYSNVSQLFDFHERASLGPKITHVMQALSEWALPRGTRIELNRDAYTRPSAIERATYYKTLHEMGAITAEEIRTIERLNGDIAPLALTGMEE